MNSTNFSQMASPTVDSYTDLNSLNKIKLEKSEDKALKKVAQQFESMFINILMKSMRAANATFEEGSLFNSSESNFYRDMYDQQLSLTLSEKKGIGIADTLYRQMQNRYLYQGGESVAASRVPSSVQGAAQRQSQAVTKEAKSVAAGPNEVQFDSPEKFVNTLLPMAEKAAQTLGVEPEFLVAQSALETAWGSKIINDENGSSFNLFNIKANRAWQGDSVAKQTGEFKFNQWTTERAQFRKYASFQDSFNDYVNFLQVNPRYQPALQGQKSGEQFMQALQESGYATDPNYANKVNSVYQRVKTAMTDPNKTLL